jgi:hypothetical protein
VKTWKTQTQSTQCEPGVVMGQENSVRMSEGDWRRIWLGLVSSQAGTRWREHGSTVGGGWRRWIRYVMMCCHSLYVAVVNQKPPQQGNGGAEEQPRQCIECPSPKAEEVESFHCILLRHTQRPCHVHEDRREQTIWAAASALNQRLRRPVRCEPGGVLARAAPSL